MLDGIINVYKEQGFTSHDVVAKLRGILKQKKIGHTGTLDPAAEGVLPVCLGKGTKVCDLLTDKDKTYETVLLLGTVTDTQDTTGKVLETRPVSVTKEEVEEAIYSFIGAYDQVPPMYSALKVNGKKLYELAREGKEVERKSRPVTIHKIEILEWELPRVRFLVSCSKGTYIRTLCQDIGEKLGCGGCMDRLLRTRVDRFSIEDSLTLAQIEQIAKEQRISEIFLPVDQVFEQYTKANTKEIFDRLVYNGNPVLPEQLEEKIDKKTKIIRLYDSRDTFIGIFERKDGAEIFKPKKMFYGG